MSIHSINPKTQLPLIALILAGFLSGCGGGGGSSDPAAAAAAAAAAATAAAGPAGVSPNLGTASTYGMISGAAVTLNGTARIVGDLAIDPANALNGTGTVSGSIHNGDVIAHQARLDQNAAFTDASTRSSAQTCAVSGNLVAMPPPPCGTNTGTFTPGLYKSGSTLTIAAGGTIILDAQGNANGVFMFQMGTALTTGTGSTVVLANGAQAKNVWWIAPAGATLGVTSVFVGTVLADTGAVTVNNGTTVAGRLFSNSAAATVNTGSTVTVP
jgi:hypothetical protein